MRKPALSIVLLAVAFLTAAPVARAQVPAAPLVFHNQTGEALDIESETITTDQGAVTPLRATWRVEPGASVYLMLNNQKIMARKLEYKVRTGAGTSRWACTLTGADANGNFVVAFSRANLGQHVALVQPGAPPLGRAGGADEQAVQRAIAKILLAAVANAVGQQQPDNLGEVIAQQLALRLRDEAILSAVGDLFPQLTPAQRQGVRRVLCLSLDGQLNLDNLDRQAARDRLMTQLRQANPDVGAAAEVADFIYRVHQANRGRRR
jgi:hypothetical protein